MKKRANINIIIALLLLILNYIANSQYWEKCVNIPSAFLSNYWLDIYFLPSNSNYGWICGFNGMVLRTTDGGNSWLGSIIPDADHLESIHFPTVNTGYCSGVDGIFKSTNGGASWFNVTPPTNTNLWGCYFYDANNGVVLGNGCNGNQEFWKTTDGGVNWNVFYGTEPNSGLTDAIIYQPDGLGYAVSSGRLWITTNGGASWSIYANSGSNIWQEELTEYSGSFLLPFAGDDCPGAGNGGGMRFTTNDGATWNNYNANDKMFGAFLLNKTTGWACGYNQRIFYTSNAGQSWSMMNCGIDSGHLDDMWFIDAGTGWVVGEGVYRLAPPSIKASKDSINFGDVCPPNKKYDTLWLKNLSFNSASIQLQITGKDWQEFRIVEPDISYIAQQCQSTRIIIEFIPSGTGRKDASLYISGNSKNIIIPIVGRSEMSTATISDTLMIINRARCGFDSRDTITWRSPANNDRIISVQFIEGDTSIKYKSYYPQTIYNYGTNTDFGINPSDTGWYSARFKVLLSPCDKDTFLTFKAYGVSPIITSDKIRNFSGKCSASVTDTIKINNTGNDELIISSALILDVNSGFSIKGWMSGKTLPIKLKPDEFDYIIISFDKNKSSGFTTLRIINNDSTRARGRKNPFDIRLEADIKYSDIVIKDTLIDLGNICLGDSVSKTIEISNIGNVASEITLLGQPATWLKLAPAVFPINLKNNDTLNLTIYAKPDKAGYFIENIKLKSAFCEETFDLTIKLVVLQAIIEPAPSLISGLIKTFQPEVRTITLNSTGNADLTITALTLKPARAEWTVRCLKPLPQFLKAGGTLQLDLEFLSNQDTTLTSELCFIADGLCPLEVCIPVDLTSRNTSISYTPQDIDFGLMKCTPTKTSDTVKITNDGTTDETIQSITFETPNSIFTIAGNFSIPYNLKAGSTLVLTIEFAPVSEGKYDNKLSIEIASLPENIIIPITGSFRRTQTSVKDSIIDFGDIEYCQTLQRTISITNEGLLDDTLIITKTNNHPYFSILPSFQIIVPAMTDTTLTLSYTGPDVPYTGLNMEIFKLKSKVCGNEILITAKANIIRLKLKVLPDTLDLGNIWLGESITKIFKIINPNNINFTIEWAIVNPAEPQYSVNLNTPLEILAGDSISVPVTFNALQSGQFQRKLSILAHSNCPDTPYVILNARVRDDSFSTTVEIGDYKANGGDIVSIALTLRDAVSEAKPEKISYEIRFDPYLYYPLTGFIKNDDNYQNISFNYYYGVLSGTIDSIYSIKMFDRADTLIIFKGLMLVSIPDYTPLTISKFDINTKRNVKINKENGSLQLTDFCEPVAKLKYMFFPNFNAYLNSSIQTTDVLEITIRSNETQTLNVTISDVTGSIINHTNLDINPKQTNYFLAIDNLPQGIYFINIASRNGSFENPLFRSWRDKFIKLK